MCNYIQIKGIWSSGDLLRAKNSGYAAGDRHMVMIGPPGSGKTMLAKPSGSGVLKSEDRPRQIFEINEKFVITSLYFDLKNAFLIPKT